MEVIVIETKCQTDSKTYCNQGTVNSAQRGWLSSEMLKGWLTKWIYIENAPFAIRGAQILVNGS